MKKLHVKTGDTVVVLSGEDKWMKDDKKSADDKSEKKVRRIGKVIATSPEEGKVIVSGVNVVSKHIKARRQGEKSQILKTEGAVYACKVQLYCPNCKKGVRTNSKVVDGKKVRVCAKCGAEI